MEKRITLLVSLCAVCMNMIADDKVQMYSSFEEERDIHYRSLPIVSYNNNEVTIKSQDGTTSAYVVIKNSHGEVIYEGVHALSPSGNIINVPDGVGGDKESIEIYYDEECAYGYFQ